MDLTLIGNRIPSGSSYMEKSAAPAESVAVIRSVSTPVAVETVAAVQQPEPVPDMEQLKQAVKNLNKTMENLSQMLEFSIDESSERPVVKVMDRATKEVIRQIPTEESLEIAQALDKVQGLLIRQKA